MPGKTLEALGKDFAAANALSRQALQVERDGRDATMLHTEADSLILAIASHFVSQELPGVNFPPPTDGVLKPYVCGGVSLSKRELCERLVWLYGFEDDEHYSRKGIIDETIMFLLMAS